MSKQFTRNYDNLFSSFFGWYGSTTGSTTTPTHSYPFVRSTSGTYYSSCACYPIDIAIMGGALAILPPSTMSVTTSGGTNVPSTGIQIGTGSTEPSYEDYKLESPITSNVTLGTVTSFMVYDEDTHIYTKTYKIPISYSGSEPITVTEYGLFAYVPDGSTTSTKSCDFFNTMIYRETLETPVTLYQNDTIEITFSQSIMQPNFTEYPATE